MNERKQLQKKLRDDLINQNNVKKKNVIGFLRYENGENAYMEKKVTKRKRTGKSISEEKMCSKKGAMVWFFLAMVI